MTSATHVRALVVDDNELVRVAMTDVLNLMGDVEVVAQASTAEEALEQAAELEPDAVLLDVDMPGMGGLEGSRQLRSMLPGCAIVIYTGLGPEIEAQAREVGADVYVPKDSPFSSVVAAITDAVARRTALA